MNNNLSVATAFAQNGVKTFPCREDNFREGSVKSPYTRNGFHAASCSESQIYQWSTAYPNAIYGLPCALNNLFVLDADRHGKTDGVQSLMTLFKYFAFDWRSVPVVKTPRDGLHVLFARPTNLGRTKGILSLGIDVRDNAYIIAPCTILPDGRQYELIGGTVCQLASAIANGKLLTMPAWLIAASAQTTPSERATQAALGRGATERQIQGLIAVVSKAAVGGRNAALHWASCRAGELVSRQAACAHTLSTMLNQAGISAGLSDREARNTVSSGMRAGMAGVRHGR
ncbi:bifunctional DNA primase/polymerase [Methylobacterium goesingense]|uniref:DNA primase/polymerase bifunctional N-terminal domain-containing protein n=1 Tax=Methylobacterium goesingense TaxID=243690 RepID=A0ABV2LCM2_9HYPH|nr:bifunctional DNA primase/polymerase [Methylobacterium goesingense]GJD76173.1 hypothetical protein CFIICLFH_4423 [Methylobacterium goesingense]